MLIEKEGVNKIISILCNSFHEIDETYLLDFAKLISCIVPLTWNHEETIIGAVQMLGILFELRSHNYFNNNSTFIETMKSVWKKGLLEAIQKLPQSEFIDLTKKLATSMWQKIYNQ